MSLCILIPIGPNGACAAILGTHRTRFFSKWPGVKSLPSKDIRGSNLLGSFFVGWLGMVSFSGLLSWSFLAGFIELRSNPLQSTPTHSNPLQVTPTNSNPPQATPTNSSHFNSLHAALTHCRPLHLLQTTLETQPHAIRNYSWLPNTLYKIFQFYLFIF